jgi:outer membrane protein OmpA-like peptidoglycan-associated protein
MTRSVLLSSAIALALLATDSQRVEACGLKLTVKGAKAAKGIQPSANPSRILILGDAPSRLESSLQRAGHVVEVAPNVAAVKAKDYRVILVEDSSKAEAARSNFPEANVLAMARDPYRNLTAIEKTLERAPTSAMEKRTVLASAEKREPIAAGPEEKKSAALVGSGSEGAAASPTAAKEPAPTPVAAAATIPPPEEKKEPARTEKADKQEKAEIASRVEPKKEKAVEPEPERPSRASKAAAAKEEEPVASREEKSEPAPVASRVAPAAAPKPHKNGHIQFALGLDALSHQAKAKLQQEASWLKQNPSASLTIEGHTDNIGGADINMALSNRRADAAVRYLGQLGIDGSRLHATGLGKSKPVFGNGDDARNRCVITKQGEGE